MSFNEHNGKCPPCRILFAWSGKPLLRNACCTRCRKPLRRTTRALGTSTTRKAWTRAGAPLTLGRWERAALAATRAST